jgi:hypothetical protein
MRHLTLLATKRIRKKGSFGVSRRYRAGSRLPAFLCKTLLRSYLQEKEGTVCEEEEEEEEEEGSNITC